MFHALSSTRRAKAIAAIAVFVIGAGIFGTASANAADTTKACYIKTSDARVDDPNKGKKNDTDKSDDFLNRYCTITHSAGVFTGDPAESSFPAKSKNIGTIDTGTQAVYCQMTSKAKINGNPWWVLSKADTVTKTNTVHNWGWISADNIKEKVSAKGSVKGVPQCTNQDEWDNQLDSIVKGKAPAASPKTADATAGTACKNTGVKARQGGTIFHCNVTKDAPVYNTAHKKVNTVSAGKHGFTCQKKMTDWSNARYVWFQGGTNATSGYVAATRISQSGNGKAIKNLPTCK